MAALTWDETGSRIYETGTRKGVLYPKNASGNYSTGVAWNGLTSVTESPSGAEETSLYADDIKYLSLYSAEEFGGTIEAYTYPDAWAVCDGSAELATGVTVGQQPRRGFGMCYRTVVGNDAQNEGYGYKLHLIYGAMASPSEKSYETINDSPSAITFSWQFTTVPVAVGGDYKPTSCIVIDSTKADATKFAALEAILYGSSAYTSVANPTGNPSTSGYYERSGTSPNYIYTPSTDTSVQNGKTYYEISENGGTDPRLPLPSEIVSLFA